MFLVVPWARFSDHKNPTRRWRGRGFSRFYDSYKCLCEGSKRKRETSPKRGDHSGSRVYRVTCYTRPAIRSPFALVSMVTCTCPPSWTICYCDCLDVTPCQQTQTGNRWGEWRGRGERHRVYGKVSIDYDQYLIITTTATTVDIDNNLERYNDDNKKRKH